ncbi:EamA family transporter [Alphaproteobacteria bacterium GH1-50]|uniref:EamA family transporter n=1 Tax=Kangsaoukella pontilimi TaxID=2691042 RepID=A0A7C9IEW7_9RHOB|nr:DMT family transporter [Kangsaoukella pontilimi]MXQ07104.1 EamA family transporter [Kangsaoukella pontilimi]
MNDASRPLQAALWMIGAILSFSSMAVAGRAVADVLDTFELMMYRSLIGFAIILALGAGLGLFRDVRRDRLGLHLLRNISHFTGQNLWFYALSLITLAQLFALEFTSPIWVMILATLFLGERLTRARLAALVLGFLGALIVARPGAGGDEFGLLIAAVAAIFFAGSIVSTKSLTRTETTYGILFWLTAMQSVMGLVASGWDGDITVPPLALWPWVALVGCAGLLAHTCLTKALSLAPATVVVPMDFLRLPAIAVVGMLLYSEPLDALVLLGAALIFAGNYLNILSESRSRRRA